MCVNHSLEVGDIVKLKGDAREMMITTLGGKEALLDESKKYNGKVTCKWVENEEWTYRDFHVDELEFVRTSHGVNVEKKRGIFLFILCLLFGLNSMNAIEVQIDGIWYELVEKAKIAEVKKKSGGTYSGDIIIPEKVMYNDVEYMVTSIGDYAFYKGSDLTSITIPNSVETIEQGAFDGCYSLTNITIPSSVTRIGSDAFSDCRGLTSVHITDLSAWCNIVFNYLYSNPLFYARHLYLNDEEVKDLVIPNSVTSIGNYAFVRCSGLTSVNIPNSVTSIGNHAFSDCSGLTNVNIPNSVTTIRSGAFSKCSGLTSINIPNSVTRIGNDAFNGCSGLTHVAIPNSVETIEQGAFLGCFGLTSINIPNSVTRIGSDAFNGCSSLTSINIPNSVTEIRRKAFAGCTNLTDVYCHAEKVPSTESNAFDGSYIEYATLHVPESAINDYKATSPWSGYGTIKAISLEKYNLIYVIDQTEYKKYEIEYGETITAEACPLKEGYTFSGWSEIPETMPAHDVVIEGSFTVNHYRLTYMLDGEEYSVDSIAYGTELVQKETLTKEGHTFSGWSEVPETMPAKDVTVTGSFTVNSYTLLYTVDGAEYKKVELEYGTSITAEAEPAKEGHTFSGWSEMPATMPAQDVAVEGTFIVNRYKITYMVDGKEYALDSIAYGEAIVLKDVPVKDGYVFSGWSEVPETMPAQDVTVTGSFTVDGIDAVVSDKFVDVYTLQGVMVKRQIPLNELKNELPKGLYIVNGKKMVIR